MQGCVSTLCPFNNFIYQDLPTVSGQHYAISFWAFVTPDTSGNPRNRLVVSWDGIDVLDLVDLTNNSYVEFTINDVVAMNVFTTDVRYHRDINETRRELLGSNFPASTMVQVVALARPELLLEINAIAVIP